MRGISWKPLFTKENVVLGYFQVFSVLKKMLHLSLTCLYLFDCLYDVMVSENETRVKKTALNDVSFATQIQYLTSL